MEPKIFDIKDGEVVPTEHCYTINSLRNIIDEFGVNAGRIFSCLHYLFSLNPETNPFAHSPELGRWEKICNSVAPALDMNHEMITLAKEELREGYETTEYRAFKAFKDLMDKLVDSIKLTNPDLTKNQGNMAQIKSAVVTYKDLKSAYRESFEEYLKTVTDVKTLGGGKTSYDADMDDDLE